jgi:hypothetical protein
VKQRSIRVGVALAGVMSLSCAAQLGQEQGQLVAEGRPPFLADCAVGPPSATTVFQSGGLFDVAQGATTYTIPVQAISFLQSTQGDASQDRQRSPNYTDYGSGSDSSVIVMTDALVRATFNVRQALATPLTGDLFTCDGAGVCATTKTENAFDVGGRLFQASLAWPPEVSSSPRCSGKRKPRCFETNSTATSESR